MEQLFNGEYFFQKTQWQNLRAPYPRVDDDSPDYPEFLELAKKEGPPYQYGQGCLSDGVLGEWLSLTCGVGEMLDSRQSRKSSSGGSPLQLEKRFHRTRQHEASLFRMRRRIRIAVLLMASRRQAIASDDLLGRSLDRSRVPGGVAPDCIGKDR